MSGPLLSGMLPMTAPSTPAWSLDLARKTYSIPRWADGYFDVDADGRMAVRPDGADGPSASLSAIVDHARASGAKLPLLLRFPQILGGCGPPAARSAGSSSTGSSACLPRSS